MAYSHCTIIIIEEEVTNLRVGGGMLEELEGERKEWK